MKNIWIILQREYLTQVKKKSFILLTLLAPLLIVAFGSVIGLMFKANETQYNIAVVDKSQEFASKLKNTDILNFNIKTSDNEKSLIEALKTSESLDAILLIPNIKDNDIALEKNTQLLTNQKLSFDASTAIGNQLGDVVRNKKMQKLGVTESQMKDLDKNFKFTIKNLLNEKDKDDDMAFGVKSALSGVLMYITFMFIMIYGVRVMRSVLEEKNNRVVEIIISSVKPFELMMGKILGVTGVAVTQFSVWIIMTVCASLFIQKNFANAPQTPQIPLNKISEMQEMFGSVSNILLGTNYILIIFVFLAYFILGYLFYSSVYAAIGSAVDNETETQQFTLFAILPMMLGMYGSFSIINNPEGPLGFWLSIIPLTSPIAMIARIPFGVPIWQLVLSLVLLLGSCLGMVFIASKIYRVGILMYGNKATFKELWKWIRS